MEVRKKKCVLCWGGEYGRKEEVMLGEEEEEEKEMKKKENGEGREEGAPIFLKGREGEREN